MQDYFMDNFMNEVSETMYTMRPQQQTPVISPVPQDMVVAMAYVPYQNNDDMFSADKGLQAGTMFPILNKPFTGCGGHRHG